MWKQLRLIQGYRVHPLPSKRQHCIHPSSQADERYGKATLKSLHAGNFTLKGLPTQPPIWPQITPHIFDWLTILRTTGTHVQPLRVGRYCRVNKCCFKFIGLRLKCDLRLASRKGERERESGGCQFTHGAEQSGPSKDPLSQSQTVLSVYRHWLKGGP